jgi:hypothetical protein
VAHVVENPYIPNATAQVAELMRRNGWTADHPTYRREYLGEWVLDRNALIYPFSHVRNGLDRLPEAEWRYCLGVDLGYRDATAFVLVACRSNDPCVYVIDAWKRSGMIPNTIAAQCLRYRDKLKGLRIVIDEGGLGKGYAEELRQRHKIGCEAAEKQSKRAFQEIVRGEFLAGTVKVLESRCRPLLDEIGVLTWDEKGEKEDERFENHAADAMLYAVRSLRPWYRPELEEPKAGTAEWWAAKDQASREAVLAKVKDKTKRGRLRRSDLVRRVREMA